MSSVIKMAEEGNAIAAHVAMIAHYIRKLEVSPEREGQLAANVAAAILLALREMPQDPADG